MTRQQSTQLLEILFGSWGGLPDDPDLISSFHYAWEESNFGDVEQAIRKYIRTEEKRPTPAGIMKMIVRRPAGQEPDRDFVLKYLKQQMARGLVAVFEEIGNRKFTFSFVHREDAIRVPGNIIYNEVHVPRWKRK